MAIFGGHLQDLGVSIAYQGELRIGATFHDDFVCSPRSAWTANSGDILNRIKFFEK
jgi:hypothetical protein